MVFNTRLSGGSVRGTRGRNGLEHELRRLGRPNEQGWLPLPDGADHCTVKVTTTAAWSEDPHTASCASGVIPVLSGG